MSKTLKPITDLNARDARALIDGTVNAGVLEELERQERAHPSYAGGRRSVLAYLAARRALLETGEGSALAEDREPEVLGSPEPWSIGQWAGLPQYNCAHCRFQTLEHADMVRHASDAHGIAVAPVVEPATPPVAPPDALWTEAAWAGHPQFNCALCRFQTLERSDLEHHLATVHPLEWRWHLKRKPRS